MLHSLSANRRKAWIGIGISDRYVPVLKSMGKVIKNNSYSELIIIIADKIDCKYNLRDRKECVENLFDLASQIKIPNCQLKVVSYGFLHDNKEYLGILEKYRKMLDEDSDFKNKVISLVRENRQGLKDERLAQASGYVLEEISGAQFFKNKGFVKIGPDEKEKKFDKLIMEFSDLTEEDFNRF